MFKFLWSNKPDKTKRDIIVLDYTLGGIRMTILNYFINALKGCWIKRLIDKNNNGHWKIFYKSILEKLELGESGVSPHKYLTVNGIIFQEKWHLTSKGPNKIKYLNKERNVTQKI